jgi:tetratricopeptide (TPR) repeat protein
VVEVLTIPTCEAKALRAIALAASAAVFLAAGSRANATITEDEAASRYFGARIAEIDGREGDALKDYALLFRADASSTILAERLYQNAMMRGDIAAAITAVRALELRNETDATAPLLLFADAFKRKDWNHADVAIAEMAAKSNFGFIAPVLRSWVNVAQGKPHGFSAAAARGNPMLGYYSDDQTAYLELASGNLSVAKSILSGLRGIDASFARDALIVAAPIYASKNDPDFARSLLQNNQDHIDSAKKARFRNSQTRLFPAYGVAAVFTRFSVALENEKIFDQALIMARIATYLSPDSDPAKLALAQAYYSLGRRQQASDHLNKISAVSDYAQDAAGLKISWLLKDKQFTKATAIAHAQALLFPSSARATLQFAQTLEQQGDYKKAAETFKSLADNQDSYAALPRRRALHLLYLATATHKHGNWDAARGYLNEANQLYPNNPFILNYLGFTLLDRREDVSVAFEFVKRAYRLAPDSAAISDSLGWGYYLTGQYQQSVAILEKAARLSANEPTIKDHLGDAYWQAGQRVAARYAWNAAAYQANDADKQRIAMKIDIGLEKSIAAAESGGK